MDSSDQKVTSHAEKDSPIPIDGNSERSVPAINNKNIINDAAERTHFEHNLTIRQAIKYHRWAIFWCLAVR